MTTVMHRSDDFPDTHAILNIPRTPKLDPKMMEVLVETKPLAEGEECAGMLVLTTITGMRHRVYPIMRKYFTDNHAPFPPGYVVKKARRKLPESNAEVTGLYEVF